MRRPLTPKSRTRFARRSHTRRHLNPQWQHLDHSRVDSTSTSRRSTESTPTPLTRIPDRCKPTDITSDIEASLDRRTSTSPIPARPQPHTKDFTPPNPTHNSAQGQEVQRLGDVHDPTQGAPVAETTPMAESMHRYAPKPLCFVHLLRSPLAGGGGPGVWCLGRCWGCVGGWWDVFEVCGGWFLRVGACVAGVGWVVLVVAGLLGAVSRLEVASEG